jgi:hypothetical protein
MKSSSNPVMAWWAICSMTAAILVHSSESLL